MKNAIVAALLVVGACASPPIAWTRDGATERDLQMEKAQCRNQARAIAAPERNGLVAGAIAESAFKDCMVGKGWSVAP